MLKRILPLITIGFVVGFVLLRLATPAPAAPEPVHVAPVQIAPPAALPALQDAQPAPDALRLAGYLEPAILGWLALPAGEHGERDFEVREYETEVKVRDRVHVYAVALADVLTSSVIRAWADDADGHRTGLLLASVALNESRLRGYVADCHCNDPSWRVSAESGQLMRLGTCDGGHAFTVWQMHLPPDQQHAACTDPKIAATYALQRLRVSLGAWKSLRGYTGETDDEAPKAKVRLSLAAEYARSHPF
jgi:hypothetical protein